MLKKGKGASSSSGTAPPAAPTPKKVIPAEHFSENTPLVCDGTRRRAPRSQTFKFIKRVRNYPEAMRAAGYSDAEITAASVAGYTHACTLCNSFINVGYNRSAACWVTSKGNDHLKVCTAAKEMGELSAAGVCIARGGGGWRRETARCCCFERT